MKRTIERLIRRENLSSAECEEALLHMINSEDKCNASAFLVLLKAKGETAEEIYGIAKAMRSQMIKVKTSCEVMDIVGTGGDGMHTFNISTASALIAASCGVKIAKHGNRSVSSICGSADFLEALGIDINKNSEHASQAIEKDGFAFMYAPNYHPAMAKIAPIRRTLGIPTCFNLLGPLLNPASAKYMMIGVYKEELLDLFSDILKMFDIHNAMIYHGCATDELTTVGASKAIIISDTNNLSTWIKPNDFGFKKCSVENLKGGPPDINVKIMKDILNGEQSSTSDTIMLNVAYSLLVYGSVKSVEEGLKIVEDAVESGLAKQFIKRLSTSYQHLQK